MSQTLRISKGDYNITTASNANVIFSTGNVTINGNLTVTNVSYINQETITTTDVIQGNLTANAVTVNLSLTTGTTLQAKGGLQNTPIGNVNGQANSGSFTTVTANGNVTANAMTVNNSMTIGTTLGVTGNVILNSNLGVNGGTVTVFDSIIDLHTYANLATWSFDDGKDIGMRMHYYKGSDTVAFLGIENTTNSLQFIVGATETSSNVTGTFGNVQFGSLLLSNTTVSANTTSGALTVSGGAGIAGNLNVGNVITTGTLYGNAAAGAAGMISNAVGYLGMPQNSQSANYTLALIDQGKHVYITANSNVTIPANSSVSFPIGSTISVINAANIQCNISITTDTLYLAANGATGTRNISSYGMATLVKVTGNVWYINGSGIS